MQGPTAIVREGLAGGLAAGDMQSLQVEHETPLQDTHLAAGDLHAVLGA
jgi:hypothetical protein